MIVEITEYIGINQVEITEVITEVHVEYSDLGAQGLSAYQLAVIGGFTGAQTEWLASLKGKSAYEIAVIYGYTGTEAQWIAEFQTKSFFDLLIGKLSKGEKTAISDGTVQPYVFANRAGGTTTLYRHKKTDKSLDALYSGYTNGTFTGLLTQKKVTL